MTYILSIESATPHCSIALSYTNENNEIADIMTRSVDHAQQHSLYILPLIAELLADAQITKKNLAAVALGNGPGSFTGVRLALSIAQGLCFGLDLPCIPVSTLAVLGYAAKQEAQQRGIHRIMPVMDARMEEVYLGMYQLENNELSSLIKDKVANPGDVMSVLMEIGDKTTPFIAIGNGWELYQKELIKALAVEPAYIMPTEVPQAYYLAQLAHIAFEKGQWCKPEDCRPSYCRNNVVLTPPSVNQA